MTRSEAVAEMQRVLGFRTDLADTCVTQLILAQDRLERSAILPWFLLSEDSTITTLASEPRIVIPSDFLRECEDDALWRYNPEAESGEEQWTKLVKDDLDYLREVYPDTGKPTHYALSGGYFWLLPTPDDIYTIRQRYFAKGASLATDIENSWLKYAPELLIGEAGLPLAASLRDADAATEFGRKRTEGNARLVIDETARAMANRRLVMGGED